MTEQQVLYAVAVCALVTAMLRFLPFAVFGENRTAPKLVEKLGRVLPCAIMGMLVVYCLKGVSLTSVGSWLPAALGVGVTAGLYVWKRNTLVSIVLGTVCYMLLVQGVF